MGSTATLQYKGNLRTVLTHTRSGTDIETDAPTDNHGKGERFSPTDLLSASLAACMVTIMGIAAETHGIVLNDAEADVVKHMAADPRRVSRIEVHLRIRGTFSEKEKTLLERAGMTCPVFLSLHPDLEKDISFSWLD